MTNTQIQKQSTTAAPKTPTPLSVATQPRLPSASVPYTWFWGFTLSSSSQLGTILSAREHLAKSGDILSCENFGGSVLPAATR